MLCFFKLLITFLAETFSISTIGNSSNEIFSYFRFEMEKKGNDISILSLVIIAVTLSIKPKKVYGTVCLLPFYPGDKGDCRIQ